MPLSTLFVFINCYLVFKKGNNQYIVTVAMSEADITSRLTKDKMSTGQNYGSVIGCESNYGTALIIFRVIVDRH